MEISKKVCLTSLGCPRNLVDSENILKNYVTAGYKLTQDIAKADLIILNSCAFLKEARDETIKELKTIFDSKKKLASVIVTGCMLKLHLKELQKQFPDAVYKENLTSNAERLLSTFPYAYLKIAEGCSKRCSYCIIPDIKGPLKSRPIKQIVDEFKSLLDAGIFEIILIAQDLGDFGKDSGESLKELLKTLLKTKRDFWLRLLYLYPDEIDAELIEIIKSDERICPYVDMPIQHINERILKAMRRKTTPAQISNIMGKLSGITIRTSLIIGFPGETDEEFQELVEFVKKHELAYSGIFKFSKEGSASTLDNQISQEIKEKRYEILKNTLFSIQQKKHQKLIGKRVEAIVDCYHPESSLLMIARLKTQCPEVDPFIIINDAGKIKKFGEVHRVEISALSDSDLVGKII